MVLRGRDGHTGRPAVDQQPPGQRGEPGEQRTMFFADPSGNPIEIKGFADWEEVFAA